MATMTVAVIQMLMVVTMVLYFTPTADAVRGAAVYFKPSSAAPACKNPARGPWVTGVSDQLWDNGRACGRRYRVRCIGPNNGYEHPCHSRPFVDVTVVDRCYPSCNGDFNLYQPAFDKIADLEAGNIQIDYYRI